jgi:hypothetical protein
MAVPPRSRDSDVQITAPALPAGTREAAADATDWRTFLAETYGSCADLDLQEPEDLPPQQREGP